jgi:nucleoside-diphosphate-sugar epimerase
VDGTRHLLAAMKQAGVRHIIGLSTFALYDYFRLPAGSVLDENSPLEENLNSRAPYIRAKREQEDMIREQAAANGWHWTILRPGIVFGEERTWFHHLGMQISPARWICLAPDSLLPLTHVSNCAAAIVDALASEAAHGATLNLVDDDPPARGVYMQQLAARSTPRPKISSIPWSVLDHSSAIASWIHRQLFFERIALPDLLQPVSLHARSKPLRYPNERAKRILGWTPMKITADTKALPAPSGRL